MEGGCSGTTAWSPVSKSPISTITTSYIWIRSFDGIGPMAAQGLCNFVIDKLPWSIGPVEVVEHIRDLGHMVSTLILAGWRMVPVVVVKG